MSWQFFTIISVLGLSISVILQRLLIHKSKADPYAYVITFQGLIGILFTVAALIQGFQLPHIEQLIVPAVLSSICYGLGHIIYAKTLQHVEASIFSVLFASQSVWLIIFGIVLFHENLTLLQVIGALLIFISIGILIKNVRGIPQNKGIVLGLTTGFMFGVATLFWSYVGKYTDGLSWAAISFLGSSFVALVAQPKAIYKMKPFLQINTLSKLLLLAVFYAAGSLAMLYAYNSGDFAIVSPLRQTGIIVTVLFAFIFIPSERTYFVRKFIAAVVCAIGVICMVTN
jgi:drug/metabolite transporter (DMT)-like permease